MVKFAGIPLCLGLLAYARAAPLLTEVSRTAVGLAADPNNLEGGMGLTILHVDDLVNEKGEVVAERLLELDMDVDVIDDKVTLGGKPVTVGLSDITVGVRTVVNKNAKEVRDPELAKENPIEFGDVTMQVLTRECDQAIQGGQVVRHISLMERVIQVNHQKIEESDFVEMVVDVMPDGSLVRFPPNILSIHHQEENIQDATPVSRTMHRCKHHAKVLRWRLMFWWHSLPQLTRYVLTFAFVLVNVVPLVTLPVAIILMYRRRRAILAQQAARDAACVDGPKIYFVHMESDPLDYDDDSETHAPAYDAVVANQQHALGHASEKSRLVQAEYVGVVVHETSADSDDEYHGVPSEDEDEKN